MLLGVKLTAAAILLAAGAVGALTLEHGWGWVLAQWKARTAKAKAQADGVFAEVTAQVGTAVAGFEGRVKALEDGVAQLKAKVGI